MEKKNIKVNNSKELLEAIKNNRDSNIIFNEKSPSSKEDEWSEIVGRIISYVVVFLLGYILGVII